MNGPGTPWDLPVTSEPTASGSQDARERLRRVGSGQAGLWEAFQPLAQAQEDQARQAADLAEREAWAPAGMLEASNALWPHLTTPTLHLAVRSSDGDEATHVELGRYGHLAALPAPIAGEQALISSPTPCFARVVASQERQAAGVDGPLACSYLPLSPAEAVAAIGFATIEADLEAAARTAGQVLLYKVEAQAERQHAVLRVERMFGWTPDPPPEAVALPVGSRVAVLLLRQAGRHWLVQVSVAFSVMAVLSGFLLYPASAVLVLVLLGIVVLFWKLATRPGM